MLCIALAFIAASSDAQRATLGDFTVDVVASSVLRETDKPPLSYGPANVLDDDLSSVWAEGSRGDGAGQWIEVRFSRPTRVLGFALFAAHGGSDRLYVANGIVSGFTISVDGEPEGGKRESELGPSFFSAEERFYPLARVRAISRLRLTIASVSKGLKYADTCVATFRPVLDEGRAPQLTRGYFDATLALAAAAEDTLDRFLVAGEVELHVTLRKAERDKETEIKETRKLKSTDPAVREALRIVASRAKEVLASPSGEVSHHVLSTCVDFVLRGEKRNDVSAACWVREGDGPYQLNQLWYHAR